MATEALTDAKTSWLARTVQFLRDVRGEVRKVTWPTWEELKKATTVIVIVLSLALMVSSLAGKTGG